MQLHSDIFLLHVHIVVIISAKYCAPDKLFTGREVNFDSHPKLS